jgi:uncharacterized SAM-dependent methyltransferase
MSRLKSQISKSIETSKPHQPELDANQIHKDFFDLFTSNQAKDLLKYAYQDPSLYDAVTNSPDYYLFRDEVQLIQQHKDQLSEHLSGIKTLVELGPGSENGLSQKTLPLLNCAQDLHKYVAVDISQNYLEEIGPFIKSKTNLEVNLVQANFVEDSLKQISSPEPKALIMLGSTLGNFNNFETSSLLNRLSQEVRPSDRLIITIDTNQNPVSLTAAYNSKANKNFILEIMKCYGKQNHDFESMIRFFDISAEWDLSTKCVKSNIVAKLDLLLKIENLGTVDIAKGKKYCVSHSKKFSTNKFKRYLENFNLNVLNNISFQTIQMLILTKKQTSDAKFPDQDTKIYQQ